MITVDRHRQYNDEYVYEISFPNGDGQHTNGTYLTLTETEAVQLLNSLAEALGSGFTLSLGPQPEALSFRARRVTNSSN